MQLEPTPSPKVPLGAPASHSARVCHSSIVHLPPELIEAILSISRLPDVSAFAQTCRAYRDLVYRPMDGYLWRTLFLNQPEYDDPRFALGTDTPIPWNTLLQRWTAASKLLRSHLPKYTPEILQTLLEMIEYARPASHPMVLDSRNLQHLDALLRSSGFFSPDLHAPWEDDDPEQTQMLSRVKVYAGLEAVVPTRAWRRLRARSFVYDLRNYHDQNDHGPFLADGSGRVYWRHIHAIQEVIAMNIMDDVDNGLPPLPMSIKHIQSKSIPRGIADDRDWAGVGGTWKVVFCFCDHRDLLAFNQLYQSAPDLSIFQDENFEEALRFLEFELRLVNVEEAPAASSCLARPTLHFVGSVSGNARVRGRVYMTPDEQVRWSFVSGEPGQTIWSTEAIQIGGVASAFGALGSWTTVFHDAEDPVGPMWLWKIPD